MTKAEQKKAVRFTRMCRFWRTNECKMGADCTFAHSATELRPSPKPCYDFVKFGMCSRGQECRFVHEVPEKKQPRLTEMQIATFPASQPEPGHSCFLATGMMSSYAQVTPKSRMGGADTQPFTPSCGLSAHSRADTGLAVTPPGLDQIPLPMSLIGEFDHEVSTPPNEEYRRSSGSETELGVSDVVEHDWFPLPAFLGRHK